MASPLVGFVRQIRNGFACVFKCAIKRKYNMAVLTIEVWQLEHVINKVMSHYFIVLVLSLLFYL